MTTSTKGFDDYDLTTGGHSRGTITSGVHLNNEYPLVNGEVDEEQERRLQARQEHDKATGAREDHPEFTRRFLNDHAKAEAEAQNNA